MAVVQVKSRVVGRLQAEAQLRQMQDRLAEAILNAVRKSLFGQAFAINARSSTGLLNFLES